MSRLKLIRQHLGLTQKALASVLQTVQGNITAYENGRSLPERRARLLICFAASHGIALAFDHIYGDTPLPELAKPQEA